MKELNDIILSYDRAVAQNKQTALATVVKVDGSSYRRPGARMLITEDGEITGAISGGCLEGDALRRALLAMSQEQNKLVIYDTTDEDDAKLGVQLGCNGIVYILFEPIRNDDENNPINLLKKVARERKNAVIATVFNENKNEIQTGTCCFVNEDETFILNNEFGDIATESKNLLAQKTSDIKQHENSSVLYQFIPPAIQLIIAGGGNDAQPVVDIASVLGWNITVVDGRQTHATQQRFSKANQVLVSKPENVLSQLHVDAQTAFVLMTHNYNYDTALLSYLLKSDTSYIGVLGPKKKLERMLGELQENSAVVTEEQLGKIYGPVGLDIGAETSEEIAVSIIAEIKAVLSRRLGTSLKERAAAIHGSY